MARRQTVSLVLFVGVTTVLLATIVLQSLTYSDCASKLSFERKQALDGVGVSGRLADVDAVIAETRAQIARIKQLEASVLQADAASVNNQQHELQYLRDQLRKAQAAAPRPLAPVQHNVPVNAPEQPAGMSQQQRQQDEVAAGSAGVHEDATPILIIACNRPTVSRCLDKILEHRPDASRYPIVVSQDCGHAATASVIAEYANKYPNIRHIKQPDLSTPKVAANHRNFVGYYKISRHYKWALSQVFDEMNFKRVIVVEDDLEIAPDFFSYFGATAQLLEQDTSLWCVSAWNDNGKSNLVSDPAMLFRTDFFPGLGWMMRQDLWQQQLREIWPEAFWDDWMRDHHQRHNRACIRPDISRTSTFGRIGVSQGQFFDKHLKYIKLNDQPVDFHSLDLTYLKKEHYDPYFRDLVYNKAHQINNIRELPAHPEASVFRIEYNQMNALDYSNHAKDIGLMDDAKDGVHRASYHGIVSFAYNGKRVHLAPHRWQEETV